MHIDHKLKVADAIDRMSLSLRIVLSMLKTIKTNKTIKGRVVRNLSNQEQVKLNMVLKKVVLPKEFFDEVPMSKMRMTARNNWIFNLCKPCL